MVWDNIHKELVRRRPGFDVQTGTGDLGNDPFHQIIFPFYIEPSHSDELLFTLVTPAMVVDEVINIIVALFHSQRIIDDLGIIKWNHRLYEDIVLDRFIDSGVYRQADSEVLLMAYEDLIAKYYAQLYEVLSQICKQYGPHLVERMRFSRFLGSDIVLEIGDEEESASRSANYGRLNYRNVNRRFMGYKR